MLLRLQFSANFWCCWLGHQGWGHGMMFSRYNPGLWSTSLWEFGAFLVRSRVLCGARKQWQQF